MTTRTTKRIPIKFIRQAESMTRQPYLSRYFFDKDCQCLGGVNPELPGCKGQAPTLTQVRFDLYDARVTYIASLLEDGLEVPAPRGVIEEVVLQVGSGQLT